MASDGLAEMLSISESIEENSACINPSRSAPNILPTDIFSGFPGQFDALNSFILQMEQ